MTTISIHSTLASVATASKNKAPLYLYVIVLASLSIIIGLIWDISWHISIGRDGLFSAPHLAIYLGGVTAGIFSGYRVLRLTIAGTPSEKAGSVKFWGVFYGSLGNLFCIWGAIAMLTSAPFDDWWHATYGLDVTILSPPHTVLLLGMIIIQLGAIVSVLSYQNKREDQMDSTYRAFTLLLSLSAGFILCMVYTIASEYLGRHEMHNSFFYQIAAFLFPLFLVAFSVASRSRWGASQAALVYSLFLAVMVWVLPLFPATPKLGPVLNPITNFQPFDFPLLIIFPALLIDGITQRFATRNKWMRALLYGVGFVLVFLLVQWPFGNVLMASKGHWFFGTSKWYFGEDPAWIYRYDYSKEMVTTGMDLVTGMAIAALIGLLSSRIGLSWGEWMKKIVR